MRILPFDSESEWRSAAVETILCDLKRAAKNGLPTVHLCLSGGSTPKPVYETLATRDDFLDILGTTGIELWIGDERDVPPDSPYRNGSMIVDAFGPAMKAVRSHKGEQHELHINLWPALPPAEASTLYSSTLEAKIDKAGDFCCTILGIGADGHTAGLFTLADAERDAPAAFPTHAPAYPESRMTLSAPILKRSGHIVLLVKGADKSDIVKNAANGIGNYPISKFYGENLDVFYCSNKTCK
jgi:6-phosphogluconolactonase